MYTREELINLGKKYYKDTGQVPRAKKFNKNTGYCSRDWIYKEFGNWGNYLKECGFSNFIIHVKNYSDEELLDMIHSFVKDKDRSPRQKDFQGNSKYPHYSVYIKRFGSWNKAIEAAGYKAINRAIYTKEELINYLHEFVSKQNRIPSARDFQGNSPSTSSFQKTFGSWNKAIEAAGYTIVNKASPDSYSKKELLNYLWEFISDYGELPTIMDFEDRTDYPSMSTYKKYFGSWNKAIKAAGYTPNVNGGYGIPTLADDNHIYRSGYEARFVNKFLYNKYKYEIESNYPNSSKKYDWYILELDLYIELAGGLRPEVIKEKIEINKKLNRKLLVVYPKDLNNYSSLEELYKRD